MLYSTCCNYHHWLLLLCSLKNPKWLALFKYPKLLTWWMVYEMYGADKCATFLRKVQMQYSVTQDCECNSRFKGMILVSIKTKRSSLICRNTVQRTLFTLFIIRSYQAGLTTNLFHWLEETERFTRFFQITYNASHLSMISRFTYLLCFFSKNAYEKMTTSRRFYLRNERLRIFYVACWLKPDWNYCKRFWLKLTVRQT